MGGFLRPGLKTVCHHFVMLPNAAIGLPSPIGSLTLDKAVGVLRRCPPWNGFEEELKRGRACLQSWQRLCGPATRDRPTGMN